VTASVAALRAAMPAFPHVLAGVERDPLVARLAGLLDQGFLTEAGWDPATRVLGLPAAHPLLGRSLCRVDGCAATARGGRDSEAGVCWQCLTRLRGQGLDMAEIGALPQLPPLPERPAGCAVPGCQRMSPGGRQGQRTGLCQTHSRRFRRTAGMTMARFLTDPRLQPLPALGPCNVASCSRSAESEHGYCPTHYVRWRTTVTTDPQVDERHWRLTCPAVAEGGQISLRGLPPLVVLEVLLGLQQRTRDGAKANDVSLRAVCDTLRRQQVTSIAVCDAENVPGKPARSLLRALATHVRRAVTDPGSEQVNDVWDLSVFGHPGRLSFTDITQPWLCLAAKRWAGGQLPRHRGGGASKVREKISSLGRLSEVLRLRPDHGDLPAALGRPDIDNFLNRLAYCESTGAISRDRRVVVCRDVRAVLAGIRTLGLTRAGQPATGLSCDFTIGSGDIPAEPEQREPGRDLAPEVMQILCDSLDTLQPAEVRTATQISIDTGRRPEDILDLPLDCLQRDKNGAAVLVYDNAKAHRLGRRLPISQTTAAVIVAQQHLVRQRFPHTPIGELKLLPTPRRNPTGHRPITIAMLDQRHREWVDALPTLRTGDGVEVDKTRIVPYAYRHTYAQRHADAGVPIDVLADLLDHRNLNVTRRYYRIGEDRRRDAVDRVTARSFDRHGNRIWRDAQAMLESEHARYAIGEVAVPYGTCTEPSNVQAGGGACPVRYRCAGCDHFRTDVSYLPDLTAHLDDLLRTRERLTATIDGVDAWARRDATPTQQEITRIRRLINRVKGDIANLDTAERAQIDEAVAVIRRHRAVSLGMPAVRTAPPAPRTEARA
jgi:site-specific recombinase XerD